MNSVYLPEEERSVIETYDSDLPPTAFMIPQSTFFSTEPAPPDPIRKRIRDEWEALRRDFFGNS